MKKDRIANNNKHSEFRKTSLPTSHTADNKSIPFPLTPVPLLLFIALLSCALGEDPDVLRERNAHYTVSFIANGGMPVPEKQNVKSGGKIGLVPVMSKTGYAFAGWYRDADFSVKWDFAGNTVKKNTALFAKWEANSYTVAYFANDGTGTMASSTHMYDEAKPLNACAFTRSGYAFAGWVRDTESAAVEFTDGQSVINLTPYAGGTVELYALWGAHPYFVAYDTNGGSGEMENSAFAYGIGQSLRPNAFTRTGYTFAGWAGTEDGAKEFADGQNVEGLTESSGATVTLFAQWEPIAYTIAYNKNAAGAGGTMENSIHVYDEAKALNANAFAYTGYAFAGWAKSENGPAEFADKAMALNLADEDNALVTLYAQWALNRYTVAFNSNGGSAVEPILNVGHGSVIGEPAAPVKTGFVFDAWYGNEALTVLYNFSAPVTANLTLYARWLDSGSIGASINSIPAPAIGATPATAITETAQYTGTVSWSPAHSTFAPGTVYTATITLAVKEGYSLQGIPANYFSVLGAEANNAANSGLITAVFPATSATVSLAAIQGVAAPAAGATPVTAITETAQYTGTVSWSPNHVTFAAGTQYTASITVIPKEGFALQGVPANFFTAAGAAASNAGNSGVVTAVFPATAATVSLAAVQGVAAPVTGATPVTAITETDQYTGTVSWSPNHSVFAAVTTYSADISIIPKAGYTLYGVPVNFFIVAGAQTSNLANSGSVTAVFPATAPIAVTERAVQVIAPVAGVAPSTTINATAQFTGTVAWSPNDLVFAPATVYTATVTLTPTAAYTFQGVPGNVFTVAGAANVTNPANSGTVTAVFPTTDATVSITAIPGVMPPVAGVAPVTAVTETAQYTGTVEWSPNHAVFAAGTVYTATVTLTPKAGFTLYGVTADFFTVAGAASVGNAANSGVVTAVFPATDPTVSISAIPGVTPPVAGVSPVTAITETEQYTGTVAWSPNDAVFVAGTQYTVTINLTPKVDYTLFGVTDNFFTVAGAVSTVNLGNAGLITAVFPAIKTLINIEIFSQPSKTEYSIGENLNLNNLVIHALYSDSSIESIDSYIVNGFDSNTGGKKEVIISYEDKTASFFVSVNARIFTITFNSNGGDTAASPSTITITEALPPPILGSLPSQPTKKTYTFSGWNTQANGSGLFYTETSTISGNITVYAKWTIEMAWIPGGSFKMGEKLGSGSGVSQIFAYNCNISGFHISKYQVTQEQYLELTGNNPSYFSDTPAEEEVQKRRPVEQLSWYDAIEFCNLLSDREGLTQYYGINKTAGSDPDNTSSTDTLKWLVTVNEAATGYRLPTEAQWEYAAKGGMTESYTFSGSDYLYEVGWTAADNFPFSRTHEVGKKKANELGLYDMTGNVLEWCWDWYEPYQMFTFTRTDPMGASSGTYRVCRGGDFTRLHMTPDFSCSLVARFYGVSSIHDNKVGFRVARP